ncbi:MAG: GntR family transcriptional regulator [Saccharothrix sp.]|nr:GntR family transcriptional regulator [Saccharothrix sp.]
MTSKPTPTQIADDLRKRILSGDLPAGTLLTPTKDLADELGVSVSAVARAYQRLHVLGLTEAQRGQGTYVRDVAGTDRLRLLLVMQHDERGYYLQIKDPRGGDVRFQLLEPHLGVQLGEVPADVARLLEVPALDSAVVRSRVLGWKRGHEQAPRSDRPMMWSVSYLPEWVVKEVPAVRQSSPGPGGIYARIEETLGGPLTWTGQVETEIADDQAAKQLGLGRPAAVLRLFRITRAPDGRVVEVLDQRVDGAKFRATYDIPRGSTATWPVDQQPAG